MKKQLIGAIALVAMSVAAFAATSSIEGITVSDSENCSGGYVIKSEREGISKVVTYDSCLNTGMVVSDGSAESAEGAVDLSETVNIGGTDYYFPAGYTEPTVALGGNCSTGISTGNCWGKNLSELKEGYLSLVETSDFLYFQNNNLTNVDNLSNLSLADNYLGLHQNNLTNVDGLSNLSVAGYLTLNLNPNLTDISGLNNLTSVTDRVLFDDREFEVKLDADSYLCVNFSTKVKSPSGSSLTKSNVCND